MSYKQFEKIGLLANKTNKTFLIKWLSLLDSTVELWWSRVVQFTPRCPSHCPQQTSMFCLRKKKNLEIKVAKKKMICLWSPSMYILFSCYPIIRQSPSLSYVFESKKKEWKRRNKLFGNLQSYKFFIFVVYPILSWMENPIMWTV